MTVDSPTQIIYEEKQAVLVRRAALLRVISGPDQGGSSRLAEGRVRVGTAADSDLRLTDPKVSRQHVEIQIQDRGYLVRDLRSTNGTYYRGARVGEVLVGLGAEIRLGSTVLRIERGEETSQVIQAKREFGSLIGSSGPMQRVYGMLSAVAPTDATVLVEGETGTGKELVAEEIHRHSPRRHKLFSVVDCAALPKTLIESELFGHEKGAFTGAVSERIGVFEKTRGGTVFLDEIGELPLELQTRLLRVLDRRTIKRVGGDLPRKVDFRLVAATNRDLKQEVKEGRFRKDLFFRLAVVRIIVPPLRQRRDDIPRLARHFLWQAGCVDVDAVLNEELLGVLCTRSWPGNIRELRNVIERASILVDGAEALDLTPAERERKEVPPPLPAPIEQKHDPGTPPPLTLPSPYLELDYKAAKELLLGQFELQYLTRLVREHGTNISHIARGAGVDRHLIRKLLRKHGLFK